MLFRGSVPGLSRRGMAGRSHWVHLFWLGVFVVLFVPRFLSQAFDPPHQESLRSLGIDWVTYPPQFALLLISLVLPRLRRLGARTKP